MRTSLLLFSILAFGITATGADQSGSAKPTADLNLDGVWRGYVVEGKGEQPDRGSVKLELTIKGNHIVGQRTDGKPGPLGEGTYKITVGRYYQIDAVDSRSSKKVYLGICYFGPDRMTWCTATPGNKRPSDFETKGQQFLLVLKRQKQ